MTISLANADLDSRILRLIDQGGGGTAWYLAGTLGVERQRVSDRMASLKRRGIVTCRGSYWSRPKAVAA